MSQESQAISQQISLLLTEGRSAEARAGLERLLALDPEDPEARSQAGDVYAYTGAHSAAYKQYNQAAETYNRMGRADMALAVHHKILELDPSMLDQTTQTRLKLLGLLVSAEDAIVAGQYEKAVDGYREAIHQFPNHTITYQRLANLLVRLNRLDEAVQEYLVVARAFYAHGVLAKARPYFERVLELRPAQPEALASLLGCLKAENRPEEAVRFLKSAVQAQLAAGRADEALACFERLPEESRVGATPLGAAVLLQVGETARAERMVAALGRDRPEVGEFFKTLGRAAEERGDRLVAETYHRWARGGAPVEAAVPASVPAPAPPAPVASPTPGYLAVSEPLSMEDRAVLQTMGEVCLAEEMYEEARQVFQRLAMVDPDHTPYWDLLNRARAGLGLAPVFKEASPSPRSSSVTPPRATSSGAKGASTAAPVLPVLPAYVVPAPKPPVSAVESPTGSAAPKEIEEPRIEKTAAQAVQSGADATQESQAEPETVVSTAEPAETGEANGPEPGAEAPPALPEAGGALSGVPKAEEPMEAASVEADAPAQSGNGLAPEPATNVVPAQTGNAVDPSPTEALPSSATSPRRGPAPRWTLPSRLAQRRGAAPLRSLVASIWKGVQHNGHVVELGELPPAVPGVVDETEDLIE